MVAGDAARARDGVRVEMAEMQKWFHTREIASVFISDKTQV